MGGPGRDEGEEDLPRKQPVEINYLYTSHQQIIPHDSRKQSSNQAASKGNEKTTLTKTMTINLPFGSWILNAKEIKRIATGLKALSIWINETLRVR